MIVGGRGTAGLLAVAAFVVCLSLVACGSEEGSGSSLDARPRSDLIEPGTVMGSDGTLTTAYRPPGQALRGDGDADNPADIDGNGDSDSARRGGPDGDDDNPTADSYKLPDEDDKATFAYGHRPTAHDQGEIVATVKRFYTAAQAGDGATACKMFTLTRIRSVVSDYGRSLAGPTYLRGATTCAGLLVRLFAHGKYEYSGQVTILRIGVSNGVAQVIIGSKTMRASTVYLELGRAGWRVENLSAQPLP